MRSTARNRAVVFNHAAGLLGMPSRRHFSMAATNVSWASSSAVSMSPTSLTRRATTRGDSTRHTVASVAGRAVAAMTAWRSSGTRGLLEVRHFQDTAHVNAFRADEQGELARVLDRFVE